MCRQEVTHNVEVGPKGKKKERKLNMVLKYHEPEETFPRIPNNVADQLGEI
jgi:hypothetical protein